MSNEPSEVADDCPLPQRDQTKNLLLFAACTGLQYLAAPVGYVGVTQASLCHELGSSDATANLPETVYLGLTFAPIIFAWLIPYVSWLKRNLMACYATAALSQACVVAALVMPLPASVRIAAVIAQAAVAGLVQPSAIAFLWELVARGASGKKRGVALSMAFGVGPLLAVLGSLGTQLALKGSLGSLQIAGFGFPGNFAVLYAAAVPAYLLATMLASQFVVPLPEVEPTRKPFAESVFGGLWDFLRNPLLRRATLVTLLLYTGNTITSNLNLYSSEVFGESPMLHAGFQNTARFAFKVVAGLTLGWLLAKTNPRAGLLATGCLFTGSVLLATIASAEWYLVVFGVYGAGELVGVYAPNYLLSASRKEDMRRNMALVTMMMAPAAPAGYLFGVISDVGGRMFDKPTGFRISFLTCAAIMIAGILIALIKLPKDPKA